VKVEA